jgi:hypothetical protein
MTNNKSSNKPEGPSNASGPVHADHGETVSAFKAELGGIGGGVLVETAIDQFF